MISVLIYQRTLSDLRELILTVKSKELTQDTVGETNCVNVCPVDGRYEALVSMHKRL